MVLNALISVIYSTVVEAWSLAILTTPVFVLAVSAYSYYTDKKLLEFVEYASEYFIVGLITAGFLFSGFGVSVPSGGLISQLVALTYLFFVFWRY